MIDRCLLPGKRCPDVVVSQVTCTLIWRRSTNVPEELKEEADRSRRFPSWLCLMMVRVRILSADFYSAFFSLCARINQLMKLLSDFLSPREAHLKSDLANTLWSWSRGCKKFIVRGCWGDKVYWSGECKGIWEGWC